MPKKIQNFAKSALVKPVTINVGRAGAASLDVIQVPARQPYLGGQGLPRLLGPDQSRVGSEGFIHSLGP